MVQMGSWTSCVVSERDSSKKQEYVLPTAIQSEIRNLTVKIEEFRCARFLYIIRSAHPHHNIIYLVIENTSKSKSVNSIINI